MNKEDVCVLTMIMKIFQLVRDPYHMGNPFVSSLMDEISAVFKNVEWGYGLDALWKDEIYNYNIIHIHWPTLILNSHLCKKKLIKERLDEIKNKGIRIVVTCHNLEPHYTSNKDERNVYEIVYSSADVMIHLGDYSKNIMQEKYPNAKHVKIYHHTYDKLYKKASREDSIKFLKLDSKKTYILCFGAFRDVEERKLIDDVLKSIKEKEVEILAPNYYRIVKRRNIILMLINWINVKSKILFKPKLHIKGWFVKEDELPYYYGASSISLIQRKKILNSGNLPMGFMMGKVVVGPNAGNVGDILNITGNPVFDVEDEKSIIKSIEYAIALANANYGEKNEHFAREHFSTSIIAKQLYELYCETCEK